MQYLRFSVFVTVFVLGGCANSPDIKIKYYLPKATVNLSATQTITCKEENNAAGLKVVRGIYETAFDEVDVSYTTDEEKYFYLNPSDISGVFTDSKFTMSYRGDRVASFSPSVSGKGSEILSFGLQMFDIAKTSSLQLRALDSAGTPNDVPPADDTDLKNGCDVIKKIVSGNLKQFKVKHFWSIEQFEKYDKNKPDTSLGLPSSSTILLTLSDSEQSKVIKLVNEAIPSVLLRTRKQANAPVVYSSDCPKNGEEVDETILVSDDYRACLSKEGELLAVAPQEYLIVWNAEKNKEKKVSKIMIPQTGVTYTLPIPHGFWFGDGNAEFKFADNGSLTSIQYNHTSGASAANGALATIQDKLDGDTNAEKAAKLKDEADVIAQDQRLQRCRENPESCQ